MWQQCFCWKLQEDFWRCCKLFWGNWQHVLNGTFWRDICREIRKVCLKNTVRRYLSHTVYLIIGKWNLLHLLCIVWTELVCTLFIYNYGGSGSGFPDNVFLAVGMKNDNRGHPYLSHAIWRLHHESIHASSLLLKFLFGVASLPLRMDILCGWRKNIYWINWAEVHTQMTDNPA